MHSGRVREIIDATNACIAQALEFVGTHNAPPEELAAIERLRVAQANGPIHNVVLALAEVGRLQQCPARFWQEVRRAAHLTKVTLPISPDAERYS
ncbi:MAG: hypothetical protein JNM56_05560 [Planctomycetia bacterium]|nr:hypothetical protein [Planctomycetia bacterium]